MASTNPASSWRAALLLAAPLFCLLQPVQHPAPRSWSLVTAAHAEDATEAMTAEATKVAEAWLALVDTGKYEDSWTQAARQFRQAATRDQWAQAVKAVREPLGAVRTRERASAERRTSLDGAPDGEYVVIRYRTRFEHKQSALETITPVRDVDGAWRVSGYYIQ